MDTFRNSEEESNLNISKTSESAPGIITPIKSNLSAKDCKIDIQEEINMLSPDIKFRIKPLLLDDSPDRAAKETKMKARLTQITQKYHEALQQPDKIAAL